MKLAQLTPFQIKRPFTVALFPLLLLSGCLLPTKRKLPIPKAPDVVQTATAADLVAILNNRWKSFESLNVTVDIKASALKSKEGEAKDYPVFRGHILMRKPGMLRVLGQYPVVGGRMFDLASDGENFTLYIPHYSKAIKGSNKQHKHAKTLEENLRPSSFFDAMIVRGLDEGDLYAVTTDTDTTEDASRKHLLLTPEYILSIMRLKPGTMQLEPIRVVHFHREDLLPYQQDLYDSDGNLETQVYYSKYKKDGDNMYPGEVIIRRPIEEYRMVMTIDKVIENMELKDDQFQLKIPAEIKVQDLGKPDTTADPKPADPQK